MGWKLNSMGGSQNNAFDRYQTEEYLIIYRIFSYWRQANIELQLKWEDSNKTGNGFSGVTDHNEEKAMTDEFAEDYQQR